MNCYFNNQSESYTHRRDTHKVRQMMEKNSRGNTEVSEGHAREVTPIKAEKSGSMNLSSYNKSGSSQHNDGYSSNYAKRKAHESKSKARFIKIDQDEKSKTEDRPRSVVSKLQTKPNANNNMSTSKVVDLKEKRNIEKQKKQEYMGHYGQEFASIFSNTNSSYLTKY